MLILAFICSLLACSLALPAHAQTRTPSRAPRPQPPVPPAHGTPGDVRLYRVARTDGRYEIVGAYPLSPESVTPHSRIRYYKFYYNSEGRLIRIESYKGNALHQDDKYFDAVQIVIQRYTPHAGNPGTEIRYFLDAAGAPMRKDDGVYAEHLTLNEKGHCIRITNLDTNGQPMLDHSGIAHYKRTLDGEGRVVSSHFEDLDGKRCFDNKGHYEIRHAYNEQGQRISKTNTGPNGETQNDTDGIAITRWKYDAQGNVAEETYFDKDNHPAQRNKYGPHRVTYTYDNAGNLTEESCYNTSGAPSTDETHNASTIIHRYDKDGNPTEISFLDTEGFLTRSNETGYASEKLTYNEKGDLTQRTTLEEHGRPVRDPALGAATQKLYYNADRSIASIQYLDETDQLTELPLYNAAIINFEYLKNGSMRTSFLDRYGMRCEHTIFGFSIMEQPGPAGGRLVFFDAQERRVSSLRVFLLNPYVRVVCAAPFPILRNALLGTFLLVLGFFISGLFTLRDTLHALRGKTVLPSRIERWLVAVGTLCIGIGYLFWLTSVRYVHHAVGGEAPVATSTYLSVLLFLILYAYIITRLLRSIHILNVERESLLHWIRTYLRAAQIPFTERGGRFLLQPGSSEIRVAYFPLTRHAFVFYPLRNSPKGFDPNHLRRHLRQCVWEAYANGRCWFAAFANFLACGFFFASMQTSSYFLIRLLRGISGNFE
ncbi:hypothetical protein DB346_10410 [Verrucomicrobia bacterium LW23]|nr:hypothetical protein DB346_10410 [Verrucomicrobia bacterium LW23]